MEETREATRENNGCWINYIPEQFVHEHTRKSDGGKFTTVTVPSGVMAGDTEIGGFEFYIDDYQRIYPQKDPEGNVMEGKVALRFPHEDWEINMHRSVRTPEGGYENESLKVKAGAFKKGIKDERDAYAAAMKAQAQTADRTESVRRPEVNRTRSESAGIGR